MSVMVAQDRTWRCLQIFVIHLGSGEEPVASMAVRQAGAAAVAVIFRLGHANLARLIKAAVRRMAP
jgi:hypothetical protein